MPQLVRIAEYPENQLFRLTDEVDDQSGKRLTLFEVERQSEMIEYGGELFMHMNGYGSPEAKANNSQVHRTGRGVLIMTLLSKRPTPAQITERYSVT